MLEKIYFIWNDAISWKHGLKKSWFPDKFASFQCFMCGENSVKQAGDSELLKSGGWKPPKPGATVRFVLSTSQKIIKITSRDRHAPPKRSILMPPSTHLKINTWFLSSWCIPCVRSSKMTHLIEQKKKKLIKVPRFLNYFLLIFIAHIVKPRKIWFFF